MDFWLGHGTWCFWLEARSCTPTLGKSCTEADFSELAGCSEPEQEHHACGAQRCGSRSSVCSQWSRHTATVSMERSSPDNSYSFFRVAYCGVSLFNGCSFLSRISHGLCSSKYRCRPRGRLTDSWQSPLSGCCQAFQRKCEGSHYVRNVFRPTTQPHQTLAASQHNSHVMVD